MLVTNRTLFAFIDLKDPFVPSEVAGEYAPGPVLSLLATQSFDAVFLFYTPHTDRQARDTGREIAERYPAVRVSMHPLPVTDPKDYSRVMGRLAREVRDIVRATRPRDASICVSSGTAEMRAAMFLLAAVGVLPGRLLQVGSPAYPLAGPANVREVDLDTPDWAELRDLVMPLDYFDSRQASPMLAALRTSLPAAPSSEPDAEGRPAAPPLADMLSAATTGLAARALARRRPAVREVAAPSGLDDALRELGIVIGSAEMQHAAELAATVAGAEVAVLITGETGTGKELFARLVHRMSLRREARFIPINCANLPHDLVESLLFGHARGAFTGAMKEQKGIFEEADGGTLFFDEIGELPLPVQAKLLRVLDTQEVQPLGSNQARQVDVRLVAATNRDLDKMVSDGRFRQDLYYRLNVVRIGLPPLCKRPADVIPLAVAIVNKLNKARSRPRQLSKEALTRLTRHDWPGNVRELHSLLQRSLLLAPADVLGPEDLLFEQAATHRDFVSTLPEPGAGFSVEQFLNGIRAALFDKALATAKNNQAEAARLLGVTKQAVSKYLASRAGNRG